MASFNCSQMRLKSTQIFIVATIIFLTLIVTVFCVAILVRYEVETDVTSMMAIEYWDDEKAVEQADWYAEGIAELEFALHMHELQQQQARNVIVFLTSGVTTDELAAVRFQKYATRAVNMVWDNMPHVGKLKNTCSRMERCDLSSIASAMLSGVQTSYMVSGYDAAVVADSCAERIASKHEIKSIIAQAAELGLRTGFVTNQRVTGAIGTALYAHTTNTSWECDAAMPPGITPSNCPDIATQFLAGKTGQALNVILGGGRQTLVSNSLQTPLDIVVDSTCNSRDQRHYISDWIKQKQALKRNYAVLQTATALKNLQGQGLDYVLGIFNNDDLIGSTTYTPMKQLPEQQKLVELALQVLQREQQRFLLLVESTMPESIKWHKKSDMLLKLNETITKVLESVDIKETLVLSVFTNGHYRQQLKGHQIETSTVRDLFATENEAFLEQRLAELDTESLVFGQGPQAQLLHGVHEETYIAHLIAHALKMGHFA